MWYEFVSSWNRGVSATPRCQSPLQPPWLFVASAVFDEWMWVGVCVDKALTSNWTKRTFQLGAFTTVVCTLSSVVDFGSYGFSVPYVRHLQHIPIQQYTSHSAAGLPRWRYGAGRLFAACRQWLRRCYQHCLGNSATRVLSSPAARRFRLWCGLYDSKAGVLGNNASVYHLTTAASVSCRYVSCSLVWTGAVPLLGLCSISTAPSRTHTTLSLLAEMFDITGRT